MTDLPAIKIRAPLTFPIPSSDPQVPPLLIPRPDITIRPMLTPAKDEASDLLPREIPPIVPGLGKFYSNASTWAEPELEKAYELGLIPDILKDADMTKPITREEFCELAVLLYEKNGNSSFSGVSEPLYGHSEQPDPQGL